MMPENIGTDWRTLTVAMGLRPPPGVRLGRLPGLPMFGMADGFSSTIAEARKPRSTLHAALQPYAERFAQAMAHPALLRQCALAAVGSTSWDAALGPSLSLLSE